MKLYWARDYKEELRDINWLGGEDEIDGFHGVELGVTEFGPMDVAWEGYWHGGLWWEWEGCMEGDG